MQLFPARLSPSASAVNGAQGLRGLASDPFARMIQISEPPSAVRWNVNAIFFPSGDQAAPESWNSTITEASWLPSAHMRQMS